jgi:ABC-type nitrate/sulfonate/bicarbonate transport system permease component
MAEENSKNKTLLYLILILIVIGLFIIWKEVVLKDNTFTPTPSGVLKNIEINYETLENTELEDLILFEKVAESEVSGRENPFDSY